MDAKASPLVVVDVYGFGRWKSENSNGDSFDSRFSRYSNGEVTVTETDGIISFAT